MKRIYYHYELWEDWKAGLYDIEKEHDECSIEEMCHHAKGLLTNNMLFHSEASKMVSQWKNSAEVNLSNKARNRQAWVGQATVCYKYGIPERITKIAWNMMTKNQQDSANKIADRVISMWEDKYAKKILR